MNFGLDSCVIQTATWLASWKRNGSARWRASQFIQPKPAEIASWPRHVWQSHTAAAINRSGLTQAPGLSLTVLATR